MAFERLRGKRAIALFAGTSAAAVTATLVVAPILSPGPASASWFQLHEQSRIRTMRTNTPPPPASTTTTTAPRSPTTTTSTTSPGGTTTTTTTSTTGSTTTTTTSPPSSTTTTSKSCQGTTPLGLGGSWSCTLDDEFNGSSLNTSLWAPELTAQNLYVAGPDCYVNNPNTISVSGGYLNLSAVRVPTFTCVGNYTSQYETGMVTSRSLFTQTYGAFEVNAKLPASTAPGLQETFWLYPQSLTYGKWPASGEIDFAEFYSQYPNLDVPYIHYNYSSTDPNVTAYNCSIDPSQFNTYGVDWTPTSITVLYNGNVCLTDSWLNGPAPFNQPFFIALTQALGLSGSNAVNASTPLPATTQIDWVRAWTPAS
jgi:beta-glucanase (GH16 family)